MRTHAHIVQEFTVSIREHRNHWNLYWSIALNFGLVSFNRSKFQWPTTATTIQIDRPANQLSVNWDLFLSAVAPLGNPFIMYIKKKAIDFRVYRFCFVSCVRGEILLLDAVCYVWVTWSTSKMWWIHAYTQPHNTDISSHLTSYS